MTILKFPSNHPEPAFLNDIEEEGYHIYNLENAKTPGFYPKELPNYPGVPLKDLTVGDVITVRVFFGIGSGEDMRIEGGYIDLEIEEIEDDNILGNILTQLPDHFALETGSTLEIFESEILMKVDQTEH